jgi:hypothetical protein
MRVPARLSGPHLGLLLAIVGVPACQAVLVYPELPAETGELCEDGTDNDGDGDVDCADPGCWGTGCNEARIDRSGLSYCSDGIDNDETRVYDGFDPVCWESGLAPLETFSCGSIRGTVHTFDARTPADWVGARDIGPPFDSAADGLILTEDAPIGLSADLVGARIGTTVEFELALSVGAGIGIALTPLPGRASRVVGDLVVALADSVEGTSLVVGARRQLDAAERTTTRARLVDGYHRLELQLTALDTVALRLDGVQVGEWDQPFSLGEAPRLSLHVESTQGTAWLSRVSVDRPDADPCRTSVPSDNTSKDEVVHAIAGDPERLCLLVQRGDEVRSLSAARPRLERIALQARTFQGPELRWEDGAPFPLASVIPAPTLAFEAGRGRFIGAGQQQIEGTAVNAVVWFESADCIVWQRLGAPENAGWQLPTDGGGVLGYAVDAITGAHRMALLEIDDRSPAQTIWTATPPAPGQAPAFGPDEEDPFNTIDRSGLRKPEVSFAWAETVGVRLVVDDGVLGLRIIRLQPLLGPSGEPGTFDAASIEQGVLWLPPFGEAAEGIWLGHLAYTARACATCPARFGHAYFAPGGAALVRPNP